MLGINLKDVDAAGGSRPGAGGYVIVITSATNRSDKQYIEIEYDITEGQYRGYYRNFADRRGWWSAKFRRSYKAKVLPFFKQFIETVLECNGGDVPGLVIGNFEDIDEAKLVGCQLGIIYGMEEYYGDDGKLKQRPDYFNAEFVNPDVIHSGEYEVPELIREGGSASSAVGVLDTTAGFGPVSDDDMPFA